MVALMEEEEEPTPPSRECTPSWSALDHGVHSIKRVHSIMECTRVPYSSALLDNGVPYTRPYRVRVTHASSSSLILALIEYSPLLSVGERAVSERRSDAVRGRAVSRVRGRAVSRGRCVKRAVGVRVWARASQRTVEGTCA